MKDVFILNLKGKFMKSAMQNRYIKWGSIELDLKKTSTMYLYERYWKSSMKLFEGTYLRWWILVCFTLTNVINLAGLSSVENKGSIGNWWPVLNNIMVFWRRENSFQNIELNFKTLHYISNFFKQIFHW